MHLTHMYCRYYMHTYISLVLKSALELIGNIRVLKLRAIKCREECVWNGCRMEM